MLRLVLNIVGGLTLGVAAEAVWLVATPGWCSQLDRATIAGVLGGFFAALGYARYIWKR